MRVKLLIHLIRNEFKSYGLFYSVLLCALTQNAQSQDRNSILAFNFGLSVPVGMFASTLDSDDSPGYAMTGLTSDLTYSAAFEKKPLLGYSISLIAQSNLFNQDQYQKDLLSSVSNVDVDVNVFAGSWNCFGFLSGPVLNLKVSDKLTINPIIPGGYFFVSSPRLSIIVSNAFDYQSLVQESNTTLAPALSIGLGFSSKLTDRLVIFGKCEFQNCSPSFENVRLENLSTGYSDKYDFIQPMSVFNLKTGLGFLF